jgi:CAAX protease family protein
MSTIASTTQPVTSSPLKRLIIDHPLVTFFVIAFGGAWIIWLPLILAQNGLGLFPYTIPDLPFYPQSYWFAALSAVMGPTLAAFTVTAVISRKGGVQQLLRRYTLWHVGIRWYLLVFVGVPLAFLLCSSVALGVSPLLALIQKWPLYFTLYLPNVLIIALAVQIWEETGWSGFATPNLQMRFGAFRAALILGPLWALWHLPAFFVPGQIFDQKVGLITMVVQMVLLIIFATLTRIEGVS